MQSSDPTAAALAALLAPAKAAPADKGTPSPECTFDGLHDCARAMLDYANHSLLRLLERIPQLVLAVLVVLFALWFSRFVSKRMHVLHLRSSNPYMDGLVRTIVRTAIMLVAVLIALDLVGLTAVVGAVLGSAGVVGLVLGFAFRDIAENYIAGILLSVRRPFEPGDTVNIDGREGKVISVNSRATVLMTFDGTHLQIPNNLVFKSVILNYSRNPKRRFEFTMTIDGNQSIRQSQTLALEAIAGIEGVLDDPAPSWQVVENGTNGIVLRFHGWIDQRESDLAKTRSEAMRHTKAAFAHAGIQAPRTVHYIARLREQHATATPEPDHNGGTDTSVNREIDAQVAEARADATGQNLLQPDGRKP